MKKRDFRTLSAQSRYEMKVAAINMLKAKKTQKEVARYLSVRHQTVSIWWIDYKREGLKGLRNKVCGRQPGEKRVLSVQMEKEIQKAIVDKCPDQIKLPFVLWTRQAVQLFIKRRYDISMPIRTVGEYLCRWGFTPQKPIKRAYEQQPKEVRKWLDESYPKIAQRALKHGGEVHWCDETGINNHANVCRGYNPQGRTPVMRTSGKRFSISMISSITNQGQLRYMIYKGGLRVKTFIEFLNRLLKNASRKLFLILDNLRVHHAIKVKAWLRKHGDKIELFFLPSYAPEYNPDEYVNQDLKIEMGKKPRPQSDQILKSNVSNYMKSLQRKRAKVARFFNHKKVLYAAM